jgi:hypothetical protein
MTTTTAISLRITLRAAELTITSDPTLERPYRLRWEGPAPTVREHGGEVEIGYTLAGRLRALSPRGGSLGVAVNPAFRWTIELRGGVSGLRADLRDLQVGELAVTGGARDIELDLPRPRDRLELRVEGGLSGATVHRPAGVPVAVEIDGGATDLRLDDVHLGAVGGTVRQRTPAEPDGEGEIAIRVLGGASQLTIDGR